MSLHPIQTLAAGCDCGACCDWDGHGQGCNALLPDAECTCPDDGSEYHADDCPTA